MFLDFFDGKISLPLNVLSRVGQLSRAPPITLGLEPATTTPASLHLMGLEQGTLVAIGASVGTRTAATRGLHFSRGKPDNRIS